MKWDWEDKTYLLHDIKIVRLLPCKQSWRHLLCHYMFVVDQNFQKHCQADQHLKPWSNREEISVNSLEPTLVITIHQKPTWRKQLIFTQSCSSNTLLMDHTMQETKWKKKQLIFAQRVVPAIYLLMETLHYNQRNKMNKKIASVNMVVQYLVCQLGPSQV